VEVLTAGVVAGIGIEDGKSLWTLSEKFSRIVGSLEQRLQEGHTCMSHEYEASSAMERGSSQW